MQRMTREEAEEEAMNMPKMHFDDIEKWVVQHAPDEHKEAYLAIKWLAATIEQFPQAIDIKFDGGPIANIDKLIEIYRARQEK